MSFPSAALLAAWVVITLMAFAMAGLLRQQRDLQAAVIRLGGRAGGTLDGGVGRSPAPAQLRPARTGTTLTVLIADQRCTSCPDVLGEFLRLAPELPDHTEALVLTSSAGSASTGVWADLERSSAVRLLVDPAAYHVLDPGWRPALLHIDHEGIVIRAVPAGSPAALTAALVAA